MDDPKAIKLFQDLLKFRTISGEGPSGSYRECAKFLEEELKKLGFEVNTFEFVANKPVVIGTLLGEDQSLPSILLNGHYDVVPAQRDKWTKDPFAAIEEPDGRIYARGTQDMKCVCAQYLAALSRILGQKKKRFLRTLHISYVPDEEIGGMDGLNLLIHSEFFKEKMLPIGLAFDEGLANPNDAFTVFYGERLPMWIFVTVNGPTGHGSRFIENTATERLMKLCNKAFEFRTREEEIFKGKRASEGCTHCEAKKLGDVTTINLTYLNAGVPMSEGKREYIDGEEKVSLNVIPTVAKAGFDLRVPPHVPIEKITHLLDSWCKEVNATWRTAPWTDSNLMHASTSIDRKQNPWWGIFEDTIQEFGVKVEPEVFPAGTDSRFLRQIGIPSFGFSPLRKTPVLLHEHDEWLHKDVFLEGVRVYECLFSKLLDLSTHDGDVTSKRQKMGSE